ncbi:MAG TPA: hypothetical protein VHR47_00840 [Bacillota bacterium]|nr:hypothetical protein [Bacillota bacterium]
MKKYEIKSIGAGSVFRFYFVIGIVIGVIGSIVLLATGASPKDFGLDFGFVNRIGSVGLAIVTAVVGSIVDGLLCGLGGTILAVIYNIFAAGVGGITIRLVDKE